MSFSTALNNALSGLTVTSRGVEIVSNNVANALTEGYAARELVVSARSHSQGGSGVTIDGVRRVVDTPLLLERRSSEASWTNANTLADGITRIESAYGDPTELGSLTQRVTEFSTDLLSAVSRPDSAPRLDLVARSAKDMVATISTVAAEIQAVRQEAELGIAQDVATINETIEEIAELDQRIFAMNQGDRNVSALLDQRQTAIDTVNSIVEIREVPREGGKIALYTTTGTILFDGRPLELEFTPRRGITADLSYGAGDLGEITAGGVPVKIGTNSTRPANGSLQAKFELRDEIAPAAQADLDAFTRDLIERFQDPTLDTTLGAADAGLFTDDGAAFDPSNEVGISNRISLSILVDPDAGGETWRLRDGLGATAPGSVGDSSLLQRLSDRLAAPQTVASGAAAGLDLTVSGFAADITSGLATLNQQAERSVAYETVRYDTLREAELSGGVDTDNEMRQLLQLEQAYSANARVIVTLDELMDTLLRI